MFLGQRLNASWVNDGDGALIPLMFCVLLRRAKLLCSTSGMRSISPSESARSTASLLPYLIHWTSSKAGFFPVKLGLRVIRMIRPWLNSETTYGPLPTIGGVGRYEV